MNEWILHRGLAVHNDIFNPSCYLGLSSLFNKNNLYFALYECRNYIYFNQKDNNLLIGFCFLSTYILHPGYFSSKIENIDPTPSTKPNFCPSSPLYTSPLNIYSSFASFSFLFPFTWLMNFLCMEWQSFKIFSLYSSVNCLNGLIISSRESLYMR